MAKRPPAAASVPKDYFQYSIDKIDELYAAQANLRGIVGIIDSKPGRRDKDEDWLFMRRLCLKATKQVTKVIRSIDNSSFNFERKPK